MNDARKTAQARRAAALQKVKEAGEFRVEDLMQIAGLPLGTARTYVKRWQETGDIVLTRKEANTRFYISAEKRYALVDGAEAEQTPEGNMWRAMRQYRQFSPLDICTVSNAGGVEVTIEKARSYCRALMEAGYLKVLDRAVPGRREALYRLVANTGPTAPITRRVTGVWDPNTRAFVPQIPEART